MTAPAHKILVVDDEPPIRKLLRMGLGAEGYEVIEAPKGAAALELLADKPDLIILDLGLPDIQGLELLRIVRERSEGVPIIVLSSRGDEAAKVEALDIGADDYVTKPFGMKELLARIRAALRHQLQIQGERPIFQLARLHVVGQEVRALHRIERGEHARVGDALLFEPGGPRPGRCR